jgi:hypothetical protein
VSSPHIADFVHLRATQAIVPFQLTYFLGEMICFKETVMGDEGMMCSKELKMYKMRYEKEVQLYS